MKKLYVLLDNGHGNNTPGKRSPKLSNGSQFFEWQFTREVVDALYERLKTARIFMIALAVDSKLDIVIDNINLSKNSLQEIQDIIEKCSDYTIEYKDFTKIPLETCIERDSKRNHPIGEKIIRETYNKYIKND